MGKQRENDLTMISNEPSFLKEEGFERLEEDTTNRMRWVRYQKTIQDTLSQLKFIIRIDFELCIYDDPFASYLDNHQYSFENAYIEVANRRMTANEDIPDSYDSIGFAEDTEDPIDVDKWRTSITTMDEIDQLFKLIVPRENF